MIVCRSGYVYLVHVAMYFFIQFFLPSKFLFFSCLPNFSNLFSFFLFFLPLFSFKHFCFTFSFSMYRLCFEPQYSRRRLVSATKHEPRHDKTNKVTVRPAKAQISLGIRPVWSESLLAAWRKLGSLDQADLSLRWAHTHFVGFVMSWLTSICGLPADSAASLRSLVQRRISHFVSFRESMKNTWHRRPMLWRVLHPLLSGFQSVASQT